MTLLLVFFASAGLLLLGWGLLGLLLRPVFCENMITAYAIDGDAEQLEQRVRSFAWLRDGRNSGGQLVLVDCGLSEQGRMKVSCLQKQYPWLMICEKK